MGAAYGPWSPASQTEEEELSLEGEWGSDKRGEGLGGVRGEAGQPEGQGLGGGRELWFVPPRGQEPLSLLGSGTGSCSERHRGEASAIPLALTLPTLSLPGRWAQPPGAQGRFPAG